MSGRESNERARPPRRANGAAFATITAAALCASACGNGLSPGDGGASLDAADASPSCAWPCPSGWIPALVGGCGPAVVLCRDGLAAPGACDPLATAPDASTAGTASHLRLGPDGAITGPWPQPGSLPDVDWTPDAGIANCPSESGWVRAADGTCDPQITAACDATSGALPGGGCTDSGASTCPVDPMGFADPGPEAAGAVLAYVRAGADGSMADGTMQRPFPTIAAGLAAAGPGGWVLLAPGAYVESVSVTAPARLVGACAARTRIESSGGGATISAVGSAAALDVAGVTVAGTGVGIVASSGAQVRVRSASIEDAVGAGLLADGPGSTLDAADVRVTGTVAGGTAQQAGVVAVGGGAVSLGRVAVSDSAGHGVQSDGVGSSVSIVDATISGSMSVAGGALGVGLFAVRGGAMAAERVVVTANEETGAVAGGQGSSLTLRNAVVRGNGPTGMEQNGAGLFAVDSGHLSATGVLLDDNLRVGARADGATLELAQSTVRGTRAPASGGYGDALKSSARAALVATNVAMQENHGGGAVVDSSASMQLRDCLVTDTLAGNMRPMGAGLWSGAAMDARRVRVDRSTGAGVFVTNGGQLQLADSLVTGTRTDEGNYGTELGIQNAAGATVTGTTFIGNSHVIVVVVESLGVTFEDCRLVGGPPTAPEGPHGLDCQFGDVTARRIVVEHTAGSAIAAYAGCHLTVDDALVRGVSLTIPLSGFGLSAASGTLIATGALVQNTATMAALAYSGGTLSLRDSVVDGVLDGSAGVAAGAVASGDSRVDLVRVALLGTGGTALGTTPYTGLPMLEPGGQVIARDLYVRDVRPSTIQATPPPESRPTGPLVSIGLLAGTGGFVYASRATLDGAANGFLDSLGEITLEDMVVANATRLGVVRSGGVGPAPSLRRVCVTPPARTDIAEDDTLPEVHFTSAP